MSVIVDANLGLTVRETLATGVPAASKKTIIHDGYNHSATLNATSTPPVTKVAAFAKALVAGAGTIDLTALTGTLATTVDATGLKLQALKVENPSTNTNPLVITPGGANPYNFLGAAYNIQIDPGKHFEWVSENDVAAVPDVAAGAKNIAVADGGAGGTESSNWIMVFG